MTRRTIISPRFRAAGATSAVMTLKHPLVDQVFDEEVLPIDVRAKVKELRGIEVVRTDAKNTVVEMRGGSDLLSQLRRIFGTEYSISPTHTYHTMSDF